MAGEDLSVFRFYGDTEEERAADAALDGAAAVIVDVPPDQREIERGHVVAFLRAIALADDGMGRTGVASRLRQIADTIERGHHVQPEGR